MLCTPPTHETTCVILLVLIKKECNGKQLNILKTFLKYLEFRIVTFEKNVAYFPGYKNMYLINE